MKEEEEEGHALQPLFLCLCIHQQLADGVTIVTIFNQKPSSRIMRLLTLHFIRQFDHEG